MIKCHSYYTATLLFFLILGSTSTRDTTALFLAGARWKCQRVWPGFHRSVPPSYGLNFQTDLQRDFRFDIFTPYELGPDCQSDWNKLWGQSRCARHHHQDSDRFVWRQHAETGNIEIAAYSYDNGDKPFQNQGRLLKAFTTVIEPGQEVQSKMHLMQNATLFSLKPLNGTEETILIEHPNECSNYRIGYKLFLYWGGNCRAPSKVKVCFRSS